MKGNRPALDIGSKYDFRYRVRPLGNDGPDPDVVYLGEIAEMSTELSLRPDLVEMRSLPDEVQALKSGG